MRGADYVRLFALAAIWGSSFIFMRVLAPALGPVPTAAVRVLTGGLLLLAWFQIRRFNPDLGAMFLGEHITGFTLAGGAVIIAGTLLTVAPSPLRAAAPRNA